MLENISMTGSPPPMRGKELSERKCCGFLGITPAYAGKRYHAGAFFASPRDHPRLCGEKGYQVFERPLHLGSPPPMRGKASESASNIFNARITPAYAGKREFFTTVLRSSRDHPRLCGEKDISAQRMYSASGSPPPMRGKGFTQKNRAD